MSHRSRSQSETRVVRLHRTPTLRSRRKTTQSFVQTRRMGEIAFLGWGSLCWNPGSLPIAGEWRSGGPTLPLEYLPDLQQWPAHLGDRSVGRLLRDEVRVECGEHACDVDRSASSTRRADSARMDRISKWDGRRIVDRPIPRSAQHRRPDCCLARESATWRQLCRLDCASAQLLRQDGAAVQRGERYGVYALSRWGNARYRP